MTRRLPGIERKRILQIEVRPNTLEFNLDRKDRESNKPEVERPGMRIDPSYGRDIAPAVQIVPFPHEGGRYIRHEPSGEEYPEGTSPALEVLDPVGHLVPDLDTVEPIHLPRSPRVGRKAAEVVALLHGVGDESHSAAVSHVIHILLGRKLRWGNAVGAQDKVVIAVRRVVVLVAHQDTEPAMDAFPASVPPAEAHVIGDHDIVQPDFPGRADQLGKSNSAVGKRGMKVNGADDFAERVFYHSVCGFRYPKDCGMPDAEKPARLTVQPNIDYFKLF